MTYREFVEYVKDEIEGAIESRSVDPLTHFFMFNGEGNDGATLVVQNEAMLNPGARIVVWRGALVPLIHNRKFQRVALITVGPVEVDGELEENLSAGITVADGERMEGWIAPIYDEEEDSSPHLGEWDGPHLDSEIPSWEIIEGALR